MSDRSKLGFREFITDIKSIVTSPGRRFSLIHDRGVLWGSLVLLIVPAYFPFQYAGGVYFDHDPIPGYSFVLPAVVASIFVFLKLYVVHILARWFLGKTGRAEQDASFRELVTVFGYTGVPILLTAIFPIVFIALFPDQIAALIRSFHIVTISVSIAVAVALFIWNLILTVLAMRTTYSMHDAKLVGAFLLASILMGIPAWATFNIASPTHVDLNFVRPILASRWVRILASHPTAPLERRVRVSVHVDRLIYRYRDPELFDLVIFSADRPPLNRESSGGTVSVGSRSVITVDKGHHILGRIVGLPGDAVEVIRGVPRINGQSWEEPYVADEYQSGVSLPLRRLGTGEYLVLPEDRRLIEDLIDVLVVEEKNIQGRMISAKWPIGWYKFRSEIFSSPLPK